MSLFRATIPVTRNLRRLQSSVANTHPGYKGLESVKERLNVEDGKPIFVKAGAVDRVLYGLTLATCVAAVGLNVKLYWELSLK